MYSTPADLSSSYLRSAVEASLDIKKVQVEPNHKEYSVLQNIGPVIIEMTIFALHCLL
jgi:hypothetical protein